MRNSLLIVGLITVVLAACAGSQQSLYSPVTIYTTPT
jgi:hypothetical protein